VTERLNRLKERGVIEGISARLSYPKIGKSVTVFIQVSEVTVPYATFEKFVEENPHIIECHRITGSISYMMKAVVRDMQHLQSLIDELVPYGTLNTSLVIKSPVPYKKVEPVEE
jgi:Lrp/AsnC family leucine-responsive transcriptional regulator